MGEKGGQVKTLFLQLTDQLVFQSRLFTLSAGLLGEQGPGVGEGGDLQLGSCCHSTGGVGSCSWRSEESCCPCSHLVVASVTVEGGAE